MLHLHSYLCSLLYLNEVSLGAERTGYFIHFSMNSCFSNSRSSAKVFQNFVSTWLNLLVLEDLAFSEEQGQVNILRG